MIFLCWKMFVFIGGGVVVVVVVLIGIFFVI